MECHRITASQPRVSLCENTRSHFVFSTPDAPVVDARAGDGRMEEECDDDVDASRSTHRRSLGVAFDDSSVQSRWAQMTTELTRAAHITDTLAKLQRYVHDLKTHREMSQSMSKNSKMDGDGVIGMSNLVAIPMRGAAGDSALSRKRGWREKMVDERKRKASKGEQISIRN